MKARHLMTAIVASAVIGIAAVAIAAAAPRARSAGEDTRAEIVFREAREYTVRIRTQIDTPFIEDSRGSFEGAGFLVDAERGWIVTNAHVVGQSPSEVQVAFAGGSFQPARKIYVDSFSDVAIVAVDVIGTGRHPASLDRTTPPSVGEAIGAFGHPLGMPFTGTRGIVSGLTDQFGPDLLQIDATVDHGNSGGPVIALREGRVVGIATAGAGGDKADRLNFATPIKDVRRIIDLLRRGTSPCPPKMAFAPLKDEDGRYTLRVGRSFDGDRWPFEPGDRIVAVKGSGDSLRTLGDFASALRGRTGPVPVVVERSSHRLTVTVRPDSRPVVLERRGLSIDGALIAPADFEDESASQESARLIVHSVAPASDAEALGFQPLDILDSVDGRHFEDLDTLLAYISQRPAGPIAVVFRRWSLENRRIFEYHSRELPGADVKPIGPTAPPLATKG